MAPEVFKSENYNDKADVFSFAVVLYEVFHRFLVVLAAAPDGLQSSVEQYALMVSLGYRPPLGRHLAPGLAHLIRDCWQHSPADRPCMADVAARLEQLERDSSVADMDKVAGPDCAAGCLGCCIT
ncbi:kinase-like domain-containing protein [Haematococcus lacustris]